MMKKILMFLAALIVMALPCFGTVHDEKPRNSDVVEKTFMERNAKTCALYAAAFSSLSYGCAFDELMCAWVKRAGGDADAYEHVNDLTSIVSLPLFYALFYRIFAGKKTSIDASSSPKQADSTPITRRFIKRYGWVVSVYASVIAAMLSMHLTHEAIVHVCSSLKIAQPSYKEIGIMVTGIISFPLFHAIFEKILSGIHDKDQLLKKAFDTQASI